MTKANSRTLSRTLQHLIDQDIVQREVLQPLFISVEYSLTKKGKDLNKILGYMEQKMEGMLNLDSMFCYLQGASPMD